MKNRVKTVQITVKSESGETLEQFVTETDNPEELARQLLNDRQRQWLDQFLKSQESAQAKGGGT